MFYFSESSKCFRDLRDRFPRSRKIKGRRKSRKNIFLRTTKFLETPGSGTLHNVQGIGVKRVAPTTVQYCARDLASDCQYHGRQQEAPWITRTRLLYSTKASQRRDERPQDAWSHHRCCGHSGDRHVKRYSHHARFRDQEEYQREESSPRLGGSLRRPRRARPRLF